MIHRRIVAARLRHAFAAIDRGDYGPVLAAFDADVEHVFHGAHALAGTRRGRAEVVAWYARLQRLLPDLAFDIDDIAVIGPPWRTRAVVVWRDRFHLRDGSAAANRGVHVLQLRWSRVVALHIHTDTQKLAAVLETLAGQGVAEALAVPIGRPTS